MAIWYILCPFGTFLVSCTRKNLATLPVSLAFFRPINFSKCFWIDFSIVFYLWTFQTRAALSRNLMSSITLALKPTLNVSLVKILTIFFNRFLLEPLIPSSNVSRKYRSAWTKNYPYSSTYVYAYNWIDLPRL
jgi:hypothetical protein